MFIKIKIPLLLSALLFCSESYLEDNFDKDISLPTLGSSPLFWKGDQKVEGFRNMDLLSFTRPIKADKDYFKLPYNNEGLDSLVIMVGLKELTLAQYMDQLKIAGLLVIQDNKIVLEKYRLGNDETTRWLSFSVTKSIVSLLMGAAIKDGYIKNINDKVTDYLPLLKNSSYEKSNIRNILQMSSGVEWDETYDDPKSDIATANFETLALFKSLKNKKRIAKPGYRFNYNTAETNLVGTLLRSAIGNNLSTYLEEKIWKPYGMEHDAYWGLTESGGGEYGGCCISATLRDYGRLGLFAMNEGVLSDGSSNLPKGWIKESTKPSKGNKNYGYLWWLDDYDGYEASGIFGQGIYIYPPRNIVIAIQSAREDADNNQDWLKQSHLYRSLIQKLEK